MHIANWIVLAIASTLVVVISVALFMVIAFFKQLKEETRSIQSQIPELVKRQFDAEQSKMVTELETRKKAVDVSVKGLEEQLGKYRDLIQHFEKDRDVKYGNLENELKNASSNTVRLQETTNKLNDILGNVKLRGQWGERMAEDIIRDSGLLEDVNYRKQKKLASSSTKPDYTFILPDNHIVNMDVKFPLDNYLKMFNAEVDTEKEKYEKEFIKNVKDRIKEIQGREYINPAENTLDFVLLFIPNEQVFGLIQEKIPGIMDESLKQKVVLCSPLTLYAMLSVIRQAYVHFRFEKDLKKIIRHIDLFTQHYERFKTRFHEVGGFIESLENKFNEVKNVDFKRIDSKIRHIEDLKKGNKLPMDLVEEEPETLEVQDIDRDVVV